MMAKRPDDRPASMTEVIALLEASKTAPDVRQGDRRRAPKSKPELKVFNEQPLKRAGAPRTKAEPSIFARREEPEGLTVSHELNLEDLVMDVRPESATNPAASRSQAGACQGTAAEAVGDDAVRAGRPRRRGLVFLGRGGDCRAGRGVRRFRAVLRSASARRRRGPRQGMSPAPRKIAAT